ncbi:MAG: hypothetical protein ACOCXZ_01825 [Chloroflexota bacterium]
MGDFRNIFQTELEQRQREAMMRDTSHRSAVKAAIREFSLFNRNNRQRKQR